MKPRNFSPQEMFIRMAAEHSPVFSFGKWDRSFSEWKAAALPKVLETLGKWPEAVPANGELVAEWSDRGLLKRRYWIDVSPHASASLQVNLPEGLAPAEKRPAILCWHGHSAHGKDLVMGNAGSDEVKQNIQRRNYDYGHQLALKGFVTYAIDWIGFGERNDATKPHFLSTAKGRDWCNLYYLHATMLGMTSLSINLAHGRAATDFIATLPEIDAKRLGVMGLSGGGTMALWCGLTDDRYKAVEIICYSDLWARFGIRDINYCGMQVAPGLYDLVDLPDLQGLLAPTPLLVDIGSYDKCFHVDNALACYRQVENIYTAADAQNQLSLDLFPGDHAWGGNLSEPFFSSRL